MTVASSSRVLGFEITLIWKQSSGSLWAVAASVSVATLAAQGSGKKCPLPPWGTAWDFKLPNVLWWQLSLGLGSLYAGALVWVASLVFTFVCFSKLCVVVILWTCPYPLCTGVLCTLSMLPPFPPCAPVTPGQLWRWWARCCLWAFLGFPTLLEFPIGCWRLIVGDRQARGT